MSNKLYANEWLALADKNLKTADLLFREDHFTDVIGIEIQQALEKTFKALLAYNNIQIEKTHDLIKLHDINEEFIVLSPQNHELLDIITDYYLANRYPGPNYSMPSMHEIEAALKLAHQIYSVVNEFINGK
jgi:HEPN domain-containing protein